MGPYVKFMQSSGARVVPVVYQEDQERMLYKLAHLNGVLFPGGGDGCYEFGEFVFNEILKFNDQG